MSGHARLESLDLGERKQERAPGVGLKALFLKRIRKGTLRLRERGAGIVPIGAGPGQGRRSACALI